MRAIIALAVLVGCAETETTEVETETTETEPTEQTAADAFEEAAERVEENIGNENITETPAKTTTNSGESAVSSD